MPSQGGGGGGGGVIWVITELNEHKVIGPNIVKDTEDKVRVI